MTTKTATDREAEEALGQQVQRARLRLNITQAEFARRANISLTALKSLEAGKGSSVTTLWRVVRVLGKTADWWEALEPPRPVGPFDRAYGITAERKRASGKE